MKTTERTLRREDARALWAASGLTYKALTNESVARLWLMIDAELRSSRLIRKYRAGKYRVWMSGPDLVADIRCSAYYFRNRQAVTFERNGFIGFAGWADDNNVQPILSAFCDWVREMSSGVRA